jgi:KUP system potassium uptake protein
MHERAPPGRRRGRAGIAALTVGALGVVFGDIGTSPLYALQSVFAIDGGLVRPTEATVYGVISLVFWTITVIVSIKYVTFVLRADNDGEGGIMALTALVQRALGRAGAATAALVTLGVLGASLFYGDGVITPAISVLSAVEGLKVVSPDFNDVVVPLALAILAGLFAVQRWGTQRIGGLFGPVMVLWFGALALAGARVVVRDPAILKGLSPTYAATFVLDHPGVAFVAMGAVVLAVTGAEALYADVGHFGRGPIRRAWFAVVFPALTLNYLGQGALILDQPGATGNPFFLLLPSWARMPMVALATAATVIASQAVISGAYSITKQAVRLGFLPPVRIRHTSSAEAGQVYVPVVNRALFAAVVALVLGFQSSARLATAYGVSVTGTFVVTTILFLVVARALWHWAPWRLVLAGAVFLGLEATFFLANLRKVPEGGWVTLLIALVVFTLMTTWQRGRRIVSAKRAREEGSLQRFLDDLRGPGPPRVLRCPGTAVYPNAPGGTTPLALRTTVEHLHVLHERVVIISAESVHTPHVPPAEQVRVDDLGHRDDGILHVTARFGFMEAPDLPGALRRAAAQGLECDVDLQRASYFLSRTTITVTKAPGMPIWQKKLFVLLANNAAVTADQFRLPRDRTVDVGSQITL